MAKFKVGDRVRQKNGLPFSNGEHVLTVEKYHYREGPTFKETGTWLSEDSLKLANDSPIRTVTRREIVPGTYGGVVVEDVYCDSVGFDFADFDGSPASLREAARIFNEIADVLDENTVK